jgi:hypothetical protein
VVEKRYTRPRLLATKYNLLNVITVCCLQNPKKENIQNWFDVNEVVTHKRGKIAQILRETFPEKDFAFPKTSSGAIQKLQESENPVQQNMLVS